MAATATLAAQGGPMTERSVSAVRSLAACGTTDQPGAKSWLGAIYLIEQVAGESRTYRGPALDLLAAYVRERSQMGRA
jgi:hypothetical protein